MTVIEQNLLTSNHINLKFMSIITDDEMRRRVKSNDQSFVFQHGAFVSLC